MRIRPVIPGALDRSIAPSSGQAESKDAAQPVSEGAPSGPPGDYGSATEGTSRTGAAMGDPEPSTDERNA